jgi:hypothetical protein
MNGAPLLSDLHGISLLVGRADEVGPAVRARRLAGSWAVVIRGAECRTEHDLFAEFSAALQFPRYFGWNWAAFEECVADLSWLPPAPVLSA